MNLLVSHTKTNQEFARRMVVRSLLLVGCVICPASAGAAVNTRDLADLSIEELLNESITSVSKKEQRLGDAAAAITVLSNDDIRRSGATTLVDALRLVPGVDVAAANSHESAVSVRGFNNVFANKLLVMIDGRSVYSPISAGVVWDMQQTPLEDVDRIEIIRGPGATIWGANAVNGVINIVTRSAQASQGGLLYGGVGDVHKTLSGARYGGELGEHTYYRLFASYQSSNDSPLASGQNANDGWLARHGGWRVDHYADDGTQLTWQADATDVDVSGSAVHGYDINTLGRWSRSWSARSSAEVQAYYDRSVRDEPTRANVSAETIDLSAQHTFGMGSRNDVIWGVGYRHMHNTFMQSNDYVMVRNSKFDLQLFSVFAQDEFQVLPDRLTLTAGLKLEHNDFTGFELQPSVRAMFKPAQSQTVWAAVSRAVRTPALSESKDAFAVTAGAPIQGPDGGFYIPTVVNNGDPAAEVLRAYEFGYRIQPERRVSVDLASFYNVYSGLIAFADIKRWVPGTPVGIAELPSTNLLSGKSYGGEIAMTFAPLDRWRLTGSYSLLREHFMGPKNVNQLGLGSLSPEHQVSLRSAYDVTAQLKLDVQLRYVEHIESVPSYVTADVRLAYRCSEQLEFSLTGQNLLQKQHPELGVQPLTVTAEVPRSVYGKFAWRF
jgi:iron complex outermembrane recepter protein